MSCASGAFELPKLEWESSATTGVKAEAANLFGRKQRHFGDLLGAEDCG